jgi:hypothetical protein
MSHLGSGATGQEGNQPPRAEPYLVVSCDLSQLAPTAGSFWSADLRQGRPPTAG